MNIGEWLEKGGQLTVIVDHSEDLELAKQSVHANRDRCPDPSCNHAAVYAARGRMERAGLWNRGPRGGNRT